MPTRLPPCRDRSRTTGTQPDRHLTPTHSRSVCLGCCPSSLITHCCACERANTRPPTTQLHPRRPISPEPHATTTTQHVRQPPAADSAAPAVVPPPPHHTSRRPRPPPRAAPDPRAHTNHPLPRPQRRLMAAARHPGARRRPLRLPPAAAAEHHLRLHRRRLGTSRDMRVGLPLRARHGAQCRWVLPGRRCVVHDGGVYGVC